MASVKLFFIISLMTLFGFSAYSRSVQVIEGVILRDKEGKAILVKNAPKKQLSFYIKTDSAQVPVYFNAKVQPWSFKCDQPIKFFGEFDNGVLVSNSFYSECQPPIEMADKMYENGKIYVVLGVIGILFLGLFGFMIVTNMQVNQLKKEAKDLT